MPDLVAERYYPRDPLMEAIGMATEEGRIGENGMAMALQRAHRDDALLFLTTGSLQRAVVLGRLYGDDLAEAVKGGHPRRFQHTAGVAWVHDSFGNPDHAARWVKPLIRWGVVHGRLASGERMAYRRANTGRIGWVRIPTYPQGDCHE